ncbi:Uncharacterized protein OBRU01_21242, partial [Operophtera brumata]
IPRPVESRGSMMCFLNVLRLHVSQSQRQKRLYKQYMEQLAGAYVERCPELSPLPWERRHRVTTPEWQYTLSCDEHYWFGEQFTRSCCVSQCSDSGRCSSPCCSEVIFNGGQHFSGKRHACQRYPVCYPGNFGRYHSHTVPTLPDQNKRVDRCPVPQTKTDGAS